MSVVDLALDWISQDPDPQTRAELQALVDADDTAALEDRFGSRLQFGTAGLRGALGGGPNRMNRVIVAKAAAGLAAYLRREVDGEPSVVVGYDARHNSDVFARDTAEIMQAAGVRAYLLPVHLPTPVLAHAILHLGCSAGVMVTASHNPPQDNGYKVYLGDSSQIVPPADTDISALIDEVGRVDELPRSDDYTVCGPDVAEAYVQAVVDLAHDGPRDVVAVYTPMHGVGRDTLVEVVRRTGFPALHVVPEQGDPDPDFPTVAFPNPEEPGAMDLALKLAAEVEADVIVANDPDADRCAVGVRDGEAFRMLTGDQTGVLLAELLLRRGVDGTHAPRPARRPLPRARSARDRPAVGARRRPVDHRRRHEHAAHHAAATAGRPGGDGRRRPRRRVRGPPAHRRDPPRPGSAAGDGGRPARTRDRLGAHHLPPVGH